MSAVSIDRQLAVVEAPINYLADMAEKPYSYTYTPPAGTPQTNRRVSSVTRPIYDARSIAGGLSLEQQGFVLVHHSSAVQDFYSDEEVKTVYYPECEKLLKEANGAARVVVFDHIVRNAARAKIDKMVKLPAKGAHNDYTFWSGPQRVRDFFPDEANQLLRRRFAIINVWRPVRGPVMESPFAICDAQTIGVDDFVTSDLIYPSSARRDARAQVQSAPSMVLFPGDAPGRSRIAQMLRLGRRRPRANDGAHRLR